MTANFLFFVVQTAEQNRLFRSIFPISWDNVMPNLIAAVMVVARENILKHLYTK